MTPVTRRALGRGAGILSAAQALNGCTGSHARPGSGATAARSMSGLREYVRLGSSPTFSGVDFDHVSPDPAAVEGTVATAAVDPSRSQCLFLWEEDNVPATTTPSGGGYDPVGFRPSVTSVPAAGGTGGAGARNSTGGTAGTAGTATTVKGAVLLCAGGAFALRGDRSDCYPTSERLTALGYHCFVVDYRVRPWTQAEAGTDLARAIRFVRTHADDYGLPSPGHVALVGYSAGGILCGETILNWSGSTSPAGLDAGYMPDELDSVSADAAATAMIYSFYGRLSVAELDADRLTGAAPTYYCYGTEDPFYDQFEAQVEVMSACGATLHARVLEGWPHGFGAEGGWVEEYDVFMQEAFSAT